MESRGIKLYSRVRSRSPRSVCPFHDESEGSFTVYADSQRFHCFGCDAWGDALDFIRRLDGASIQEAARTLQRQPADSSEVSLLRTQAPSRPADRIARWSALRSPTIGTTCWARLRDSPGATTSGSAASAGQRRKRCSSATAPEAA